MAKILFFGTCAGTEPIKGMHHCSLALEANGIYYWFDAGENCSRTATELGVDLLKVKTIMISHTHIDHVGGLVNLLWCMRKLIYVRKDSTNRELTVFIPNMKCFEGIMTILESGYGKGFFQNLAVKVQRPFDGLIYQDENIKVSAVHNHHIREVGEDGPLSYSYAIEVEGKKVIFSGDVGSLSDLEGCVDGGCDILICETGHHKVKDVCEMADKKGVKTLLFSHNGREIINHRQEVEERLLQCRCKAMICYDKMIFGIDD